MNIIDNFKKIIASIRGEKDSYDIKLKDFHNQPLCNDKDSPWSKSYHATPNHKDFDLFQKYAKHIADMTTKNKQNEQK